MRASHLALHDLLARDPCSRIPAWNLLTIELAWKAIGVALLNCQQRIATLHKGEHAVAVWMAETLSLVCLISIITFVC
jgi:hypothetical protein